MSERKRFTAEQKALVLRDVLEKGMPVSEAAEKYGVHVNDIYNWKKKLFENASDLFASPRAKASKESAEARRIEQLEKTLKLREQAIDYLLNETVKLKKKTDGDA